MLPKAKRLTTKDFKGVRPKPVFRGTYFDVSVAPSLHGTKFACIVAKKRLKRAVDRNKARRKAYTHLQGMQTSKDLLVFIYPTQAILQAPHTVVEEEMRAAFATL